MTAPAPLPLRPGDINWYGDFCPYPGFGGVHSYVDPTSGAVTLQGCFSTNTSRAIVPNAATKIGFVQDPAAQPAGSARHAGPASVRIGNRWYAGLVTVFNDSNPPGGPEAMSPIGGTFAVMCDGSGIIAECVFTLTYPGTTQPLPVPGP